MSEPRPQELTIRPALEADASAIARILRSLGWFEPLQVQASSETEAQVRRHVGLCRADGSHSVYVAEEAQSGVIGYASVHWLPYLILPGPEGYLSELFIDEAHRGRGIGKRLLDRVVQEARSRGCWRLMLVTGRGRDSYKRAFYVKQGWVEREGVANFVLKL